MTGTDISDLYIEVHHNRTNSETPLDKQNQHCRIKERGREQKSSSRNTYILCCDPCVYIELLCQVCEIPDMKQCFYTHRDTRSVHKLIMTITLCVCVFWGEILKCIRTQSCVCVVRKHWCTAIQKCVWTLIQPMVPGLNVQVRVSPSIFICVCVRGCACACWANRQPFLRVLVSSVVESGCGSRILWLSSHAGCSPVGGSAANIARSLPLLGPAAPQCFASGVFPRRPALLPTTASLAHRACLKRNVTTGCLFKTLTRIVETFVAIRLHFKPYKRTLSYTIAC